MNIHPAVFDLAELCDASSSRYALGGMLFRRKQGLRSVEAVATDGRAIGCIAWHVESVHEAGDWQALVPYSLLLEARIAYQRATKAKKKQKKPLATIDITFTATAATIVISNTTGQSVTISQRLVEGRFPDVDPLIYDAKPAPQDRTHATMDPAYVGKLCAIAKAINADDPCHFKFRDAGAVEFWTEGEVTFRAVLMEMESNKVPPIGLAAPSEGTNADFKRREEEFAKRETELKLQVTSLKDKCRTMAAQVKGLPEQIERSVKALELAAV